MLDNIFGGDAISALVFLGAVTPFATAILTKLKDPDWFKGLVSLTLAVLVGVGASLEIGGDIVFNEVAQNAFGVWLIHLMTYFGVSKDAVTRTAQATAKFAPIALSKTSFDL